LKYTIILQKLAKNFECETWFPGDESKTTIGGQAPPEGCPVFSSDPTDTQS